MSETVNSNGRLGIRTEKLQADPGAQELHRIIATMKTGELPDPADAAQAAFTSSGEFNRAKIIDQAATEFKAGYPAQAWELITPLLAGAELRAGLELVDNWHELDTPPREWLIYGWLPVYAGARMGELTALWQEAEERQT